MTRISSATQPLVKVMRPPLPSRVEALTRQEFSVHSPGEEPPFHRDQDERPSAATPLSLTRSVESMT